MATEIGIGFSNHVDTATAAQEAAKEAREQIRQPRLDFAIVLTTAHYDAKRAVPVIHKLLDQTKLIGTSTAGILFSDRIETKGIGVLAFSSDEIKFETGMVNHLNLQDTRDGGRVLADSCRAEFGTAHRKFFLFFVDGLLNNISGLIEGLEEKTGPMFPLIGAGSVDDFQFKKTEQFHQSHVYSNSATGVMFGGRLKAGIACRHGWKALGKPRRIDKAEGHVIKHIDGKPAVSIYHEFFGEEDTRSLRHSAMGLINIRYPLGIRMEEHREFLLRNVRNVLDDDSLVCQDIMKEGSQIHILIGNRESCITAAEEAAADVKEQLGDTPPRFVLIVSSVGRYRLLGQAAYDEIRAVKNVLGAEVPVFGLYSHGEVHSYRTPLKARKTVMQNGSIIILAVH